MIGGSIPGRGWEFFSYHRVQTGSWSDLSSYPMGNRGFFPVGKAARA
jgi:hypothetical protein